MIKSSSTKANRIETLIFVESDVKNDPVKRWDLPDHLFFSNGACHILAFAFLEKYPKLDFAPFWIKPKEDFRGNHIFVANSKLAFDYNGLKEYDLYLADLKDSMKQHYDNWDFELITLNNSTLVSEEESKTYDGLWLRPPEKFLHNALPRARKYLNQFENLEQLLLS